MIIDCKSVAQKIKDDVKNIILKETAPEEHYKCVPILYIFQVGDNPASNAYIRGKLKDAEEVGIKAELIKLPETITTEELRYAIHSKCDERYTLNGVFYKCSGIILQLPVPKHIDLSKVGIPDWCDVDGFNETSWFKPCTPSGVMELIDSLNYNLDGKTVLVCGQSDIVGKPLVDMLMKRHCNIFTINSTVDHYLRNSFIHHCDVLITAVGHMNFITENEIDGKWSNAINGYENSGSCPELIIDVGINNQDGKQYGDCSETLRADEYSKCFDITPRVGGVGLLTRAKLIENVAISLYGSKEHWNL